MNRGKLRNLWTHVNRNSSIGKSSSRPTHKRAELILASALVVASGSHLASGSTASWIGTDSANFSDTANWSLAGGISGVTGANLQFGATGDTTPVNDLTSQQWATLTFLSGAQAFDLTGNGFTLAASSAASIVNNSTSSQIIDVPVTLAGSRTVDAAAGAIVFDDGLAGTSGVNIGYVSTVTGTSSTLFSTVILDSAATYSGTTAVYSGTFQIGTGGSMNSGALILGNTTSGTSAVLVLGDSSGPASQAFTSLTTGGNLTTSSIVNGNTATSADSTLTANISGSTTYFGVVGGSGTNQNDVTLIKNGTGTFTLHTSNTYTGGTVLQNGMLLLDAATAYPANTPLTMGDSNNDSATLNVYNVTASVSNLTVIGTGAMTIGSSNATGKGTFNFNGGANSATFAGTIVNTLPGGAVGTQVEVSSGTLSLTNSSNTYAEGTTLLGGTLVFSPGSIGTGTVTLDGGTLEYSLSANTTDVSAQSLVLAINGGTVNTNGNNVNFADPIIAAASNGGFTKAGSGTLTLSAVSTYPKITTVSGGTLLIASTGGIASTAASVSSGATMTVNGSINIATALTNNGTFNSNIPTMEISTLNGSGAVNLNSSTLQVDAGGSFSGSIGQSGTGGSLVVTGGTLSLSGSSTYSGATTVSGGTLLAGAANSLSPNSSINVTTGTLDVFAASQTIPSLTVGASGTLNLAVGNLLTDTGAASFGGTLNVSGTPSGPTVELMSYTSDSGTFATVPTFAGYNLVYASTELELVANAGPVGLTWNNAGGATPSDGQTWDISNNKNWNNSSSTNTVYIDGANVTFNDVNNYPANPNAYNVTLNTLVSPGSVTVNNSAGNYTIGGAGTVGGTGSLTKSGTGTLTISTPNTYSGGTTVNAGKLLIGQAGTNATFSGSTLVTANTLTALPTGALSISGSGIVQLADGVTNQTFVTPNAHSSLDTSNINLTSLSITGNGTLDIGNNRIIIDYSSPATDPIASIAAWIANGYSENNVPGSLPAIISSDVATADAASGFSYGIGYADGADNVVAGLPSGEIEIMFTLLGDANLDGIVNSEDFTPFSHNVGQSGMFWDDGDFNYDGTVNAEDFTPFSHDLGQPAALAASELGALNSPLAAANGISLANVPEPASMGLLTLGVVGILARRRRI